MKKAQSILIALLVSHGPIQAQGTFQNLNFEQATIVPVSEFQYRVDPAMALPHWTLDLGSFGSSYIFYNAISLGAPMVSIHDANGYYSLEGSYTVFIQGSSGGPSESASISQSGFIASNFQSLRFHGVGSNFVVSLDNQALPLVPLRLEASYTLFGADITRFAGQTAELRFTGLERGSLVLDNITFSIVPVPEPRVYVLGVITAVVFGVARWRKIRKR